MAGHGGEQQGRRGEARISSKCSARDPSAPLEKARAFGMTPWTRGLICSSEREFPQLMFRAGLPIRLRIEKECVP